MIDIQKAVDDVLPLSRGRFRFVLIVEGISFYSQPRHKDNFLAEWETMTGHPSLPRVQYESRSEYTPGNYIWQTF